MSAAPDCVECGAENCSRSPRCEDCEALRDKFAAAALAGLMANSEWAQESVEWSARIAYQSADAMLDARKAVPS